MSRQKSQEDLQNLRNSIDQYFYKYNNKCAINNNNSSPVQEKLKRLEKLKNLNTVQTVIIDKIQNELNKKISACRIEITTPPKSIQNHQQLVISDNYMKKHIDEKFYQMTTINSFSNEIDNMEIIYDSVPIEDLSSSMTDDTRYKKCFKPKIIYHRLVDRLKNLRK